ncbi:MAG TPA: tetratricopeptide repeat protein, partial [Vicinamibacterales bacterium]|nr:tetratricopeptide repeat protein [Vicinamibacterales bacterium]
MPWAARSSFLCLGAYVAVLGGTPAGPGAPAVQHDAAIRSVVAGQVASGDISGDLAARFSVFLTTGQFATIVVAHTGVDIVIRQPHADPLRQIVTASDGPDGEIRLPVYADVSEPLTFEVAAAYPKTARGTYAFRLVDVREATALDRQVAEGQRLHSQAVHLRGSDAFVAAGARAREALVVREKALGNVACDTARSLLLLGQIEDAAANFNGADADYLRARRIVEGSFGSHELLRAQILDSHGSNLIARGKYREAEPLVREALATRERILGPSHPLVAASTATLADFHHESANVQEAFKAAQRALETAAGVYRPTDIVFGDFLNRVARSELAMGNYARAEQLYRESLEVREKNSGVSNLAVADSLGGLARVALLTNDNAAAEERHLQSLSIRERVLGPDHPQVANDVFNLGLISYRRRDFPTALTRYGRALAIREKTFGRIHPVIALTVNNLGLVYWRQSDYPRAEEFFGRALDLSEQLYGPDSLRVTNPLGNLGIMAKEQGHYGLAETRYRRALAIKEKHLGPDHPELIVLVE